LLADRKDKKLSDAEKKLAKQSYMMEKTGGFSAACFNPKTGFAAPAFNIDDGAP
jgi:hypothetical protein